MEHVWLNPIGGLGDTLMMSGVLKHYIDIYPDKKFNLLRRWPYLSLLKGHPAIDKIGFPPDGTEIFQHTAYWSFEELGPGEKRAMQVMAKMFGLAAPVPEKFFVTGIDPNGPLFDIIPWKKKNVAIMPSSASPRKEWDFPKWRELVKRLVSKDMLVIQLGDAGSPYVPGAYSLLGVTTPRQAVSLMSRVDCVITVDNFCMHAAHYFEKPAVVLWGPTSSDTYGYPEQVHLTGGKTCDFASASCIGHGKYENYKTPCPYMDYKCVSAIEVDDVSESVDKISR